MVDLVMFTILTIVAIIGIVIVINLKLPVWKFQVVWIIFAEILGVLLLIARLSCG